MEWSWIYWKSRFSELFQEYETNFLMYRTKVFCMTKSITESVFHCICVSKKCNVPALIHTLISKNKTSKHDMSKSAQCFRMFNFGAGVAPTCFWKSIFHSLSLTVTSVLKRWIVAAKSNVTKAEIKESPETTFSLNYTEVTAVCIGTLNN